MVSFSAIGRGFSPGWSIKVGGFGDIPETSLVYKAGDDNHLQIETLRKSIKPYDIVHHSFPSKTFSSKTHK